MRLIPKSRRWRNELHGLWALTARGLTVVPTDRGPYFHGPTMRTEPGGPWIPHLRRIVASSCLSLLFFHHLSTIYHFVYPPSPSWAEIESITTRGSEDSFRPVYSDNPVTLANRIVISFSSQKYFQISWWKYMENFLSNDYARYKFCNSFLQRSVNGFSFF